MKIYLNLLQLCIVNHRLFFGHSVQIKYQLLTINRLFKLIAASCGFFAYYLHGFLLQYTVALNCVALAPRKIIS